MVYMGHGVLVYRTLWHGAIIAATVDAAVDVIVVPTGRGHRIIAKIHGNHAAGREFDGISEANIRLWRRQKIRLEALP